MIYTRPLRRTTLHFEQRFRIDDETFIYQKLLKLPAKGSIIPFSTIFVQAIFLWLWQSQDLRTVLCYRNRVLKMSCQGSIR